MCEATGSTPGELFDLPREEYHGIRAALRERARRQRAERQQAGRNRGRF